MADVMTPELRVTLAPHRVLKLLLLFFFFFFLSSIRPHGLLQSHIFSHRPQIACCNVVRKACSVVHVVFCAEFTTTWCLHEFIFYFQLDDVDVWNTGANSVKFGVE